jgi:hypothetical protein
MRKLLRSIGLAFHGMVNVPLSAPMRTLILVLLFLPIACLAAPDEKEFKPLFNGRDLSGWQHRGPVTKNNSWAVENGNLKNDLRQGKRGSDLVSEGKYLNFTLRFEFQVPEGSNSGVYLRGRHEIQLTGDYSSRKVGPVGNGAIWNIKAPDSYASKPSGEWQSMEATMIGQEVTVFLNGTKIHDKVRCEKAMGSAIDSNVSAPGPIMLQGRLGSIKFRKLRIKELPSH